MENFILLKQQGKYQQAIQYFKQQIYPQYSRKELQNLPRMIQNLLYCLRKTNQSAAALKFYYNFISPQLPQYLPLKHEIAWNVNKLLANPKQYSVVRKKALQLAAQLTPKTDNTAFSVVFFKIVQLETRQSNPDYPKLLQILENIPANELSTQKYALPSKPQQLLASELEKYYLTICKIAYAACEYDKCLHHARQAQQNPHILKSQKLKWIQRIEALALAKKQQYSQALLILSRLTARYKQWYMAHETAQIARQINDSATELLYITIALYLTGIIDYKIKVLAQLEQNNLISPHIQQLTQTLQQFIKNRNQWTKQQLAPPQPTHPHDKLHSLYITLCRQLSQTCTEHNILQKGTLSRILHPQKNGDGFITCNKKHYYLKWQQILNAPPQFSPPNNTVFYFVPAQSSYKNKKRWIAEMPLIELKQLSPQQH